MLSPDEPARVFHRRMKEKLALHDMIVLGVVNEQHPAGVFNPDSLRKIVSLTEYAAKLRGDTDAGRAIGLKPGEGVIEKDLIAPSRVDAIIPDPLDFPYLVNEKAPPKTQAEADVIRQRAMRVPFLKGHHRFRGRQGDHPVPAADEQGPQPRRLPGPAKKIATFAGDEQYHITGLPVAEDTFGVRDVHPDGDLGPAGDADDLHPDAGFLPQARADRLADDHRHGDGADDDGPAHRRWAFPCTS